MIVNGEIDPCRVGIKASVKCPGFQPVLAITQLAGIYGLRPALPPYRCCPLPIVDSEPDDEEREGSVDSGSPDSEGAVDD